ILFPRRVSYPSCPCPQDRLRRYLLLSPFLLPVNALPILASLPPRHLPNLLARFSLPADFRARANVFCRSTQRRAGCAKFLKNAGLNAGCPALTTQEASLTLSIFKFST